MDIIPKNIPKFYIILFAFLFIIAGIWVGFPINEKEGLDTNTNSSTVPKCKTDDDCNSIVWDPSQQKNICKSDGTCHCRTGRGTFCQIGPTNYKNPMDMTPKEILDFKSRYRNDMTMADYHNWLYLFRSEIGRLPYIHQQNLKKIERGERIEMPKEIDVDLEVTNLSKYPYTTAEPEDYFAGKYEGVKYLRDDKDRMMLEREKKLLEILQKPQMLPLSSDLTSIDKAKFGWLPSNISDYKDTTPPEDVLLPLSEYSGSDIRTKVDAHALNYFIRPNVATGDLDNTLGRMWRQKKEEEMLSADEHAEDYHNRDHAFARYTDTKTT